MKSFIIILSFGFAGYSAFGQNHNQLVIQHIDLQDSVIVQEIRRLLFEQRTDTAIQKITNNTLGYVNLYVYTYNGTSDILRRYDFTISYFSLTKKAPDDTYPMFYTYVSGTLVLVHFNQDKHVLKLSFTPSSKARLRKRVNQFLEKTSRQVFRDMNGKKVFVDRNFRVEYFGFDSGKVLYIKKDGSTIVRMANDFRPVE